MDVVLCCLLLLSTQIDQVLSVEEFRILPHCLKLPCCPGCSKSIGRMFAKLKEQPVTIKPNEKPNTWQKIWAWLEDFFGVVLHQFKTLEVINEVKRPEKVLLLYL